MRYYLNMDFEEYQLFKGTENYFVQGEPADIGDIIHHKGKRYSVRVRDSDKETALIRDISDSSKDVDDGDDYEDELKCPCCGEEQDADDKEDYEDEYECNSCNSVFFYERHISVSWSTILKKKAREIEI